MKKILLYISIALAVASCDKSEEVYDDFGGADYVRFKASTPTRVTEDGTAWEANDPIGITTYDDATKTYTHNLSYKISNVSTGEMDVDGDDTNRIITDGELQYIAYSPRTTTAYDDGVITCDLTASQEPLLVAKTTSSDESVSLTFSHKYVLLSFTFTGYGDAADLSKATAQLTGAYAKGQYSLTSGNWGGLDVAPIDITIKDGKAMIYALPQFPKDKGVKVMVTLDGDEYATAITTEQWVAGKTYSYNINVGEVDNTVFAANYFDIANSTFVNAATPSATSEVVFSTATDVNYNTSVLPNGSNIIDITSSQDLNTYFESYIIGIAGVDGYYTINTSDLVITQNGGTYSTQIILNYGAELSADHTITLQGILADDTITVVGAYDVEKMAVAGDDLCVNLTWTDTGETIMDLDIFLYEPEWKNWIYFGTSLSDYSTYDTKFAPADYGLDNDSATSKSPNENIVVPDDKIQSGDYIVGVSLFDRYGISQQVDYVITATYKGTLIELEYDTKYPTATNPYMGYYDGNSTSDKDESKITITTLFRFKIK